MALNSVLEFAGRRTQITPQHLRHRLLLLQRLFGKLAVSRATSAFLLATTGRIAMSCSLLGRTLERLGRCVFACFVASSHLPSLRLRTRHRTDLNYHGGRGFRERPMSALGQKQHVQRTSPRPRSARSGHSRAPRIVESGNADLQHLRADDASLSLSCQPSWVA